MSEQSPEPSPEPRAEPRAQSPSSTTLPGLKELLSKVREKYRLRESRSRSGFLALRVHPEVHYIWTQQLDPEDKKLLIEAFERSVALVDLGFINLRENPTVVIRKAVATITVEEVELTDIEKELQTCRERLEHYKDKLKLYEDKEKHYKDKIQFYEKLLAHQPQRVEELERRYKALTELVNESIHLINRVLQPSITDFARSPSKQREFEKLAREYLDRVRAFKASLTEGKE